MATILVIDNDREVCRSLEKIFVQEGYFVEMANRGQKALTLMSEKDFDIIYSEINLPDMHGFDILSYSKKRIPSPKLFFIIGTPNMETAVEAIKLGALDCLRKPLIPDKIMVITRRALESIALAAEVESLKLEVSQCFGIDNIVTGKSQKMNEIFKIIMQAAGSNSNVLITGESGTGKELIARAVHYTSQRMDNRFVAINCAAISRELIEAELFGYVKGAFSGALRDKKGFLDLASGGTLFLDEIGETTTDFQVKLLRAIQEGEFNRVGDPYPTRVDVRVIAASNRNLEKAKADGFFRKDLFYRLNVISIHIPPLRERQEDIPFLAQHFLEKYLKKRKDRKVAEISAGALDLLMTYDYPGNVRELENAIDYAVTFAHGNEITEIDLPLPMRQKKTISLPFVRLKPLKTARSEFERNFITAALKECRGNISKASLVLGLQRQNLQHKIKSLGIISSAFKK